MVTPLLSSLLPQLAWPLVWAGYRLPILALLSLWIILSGQLKSQTQVADDIEGAA